MRRKAIETAGVSAIALGRYGEEANGEVIFHPPEGTETAHWELTHYPAGGKAPYTAALTVRGDSLIWEISAEDLEEPGNGYAVLHCPGHLLQWKTVVQGGNSKGNGPAMPQGTFWGGLLVKILSAGTYAEDQTENINALAQMLGVEVDYLTALLGDALLGEMILGT